MGTKDQLPESVRHRVKVWYDDKRDCYVSDIAFVLAKANAGDTLEFKNYQSRCKKMMVEIMIDGLKRMGLTSDG